MTVVKNNIKRNFDKRVQRLRKTDNILRKYSFLIEGEAKKNSPINTGFLRSSGFSNKIGALKYQIGFSAPYAPYLEYGTKYIVGRFFLKNAVSFHKNKLQREIKKLIKI